MPSPTLILPSQWEITKTTTLIEQKTELGDGYSQYMSVGMNPVIIEWDVRSPVMTRTKVNLVVSQLEAFSGFVTFNWSPDNGATIPLAGHFCEEWNVTAYAPNALMIEAKFTEDSASECIALDLNTDTDLMKVQLSGIVNFFNTYTRSTQPMVANLQGVTVSSFTSATGRRGYLPTSTGTSNGQTLLIVGLLYARKYLTLNIDKNTALNLAQLYTNAFVNYFYQESIPTNPTSKIWLPHWLVNAKESFTSEGVLGGNITNDTTGYFDDIFLNTSNNKTFKLLNSGYFNVTVNFAFGVGTLSSSSPNFGDKLSDIYRIYSLDGKLLWQNVNATVSFGTEYAVNYWVSNQSLKGQNYRMYPTSNRYGGVTPITTSESAGKIVLTSNYSGDLLIVYSAYTGATVGINESVEVYPITRPTQSNPKEKNHTLDASYSICNAFNEMYLATGNNTYNIAKQATIYSTGLAAQVVNDSYLFKVDLTSSDPFSVPGTRLIITNNSASGSATRNGNGWVVSNINNGTELNPIAEIQNFNVVSQIQPGVTVDVSLGCSQNTILEVYLSLAISKVDNTKNYTFYQPVVGGTDYNISILPSEFVKYNSSNWWHSRITEVPIITYNTESSTATASIGLESIEGFKRLTSTVTLNQVSESITRVGFTMSNIGNMPPDIYYFKSGVQAKLKITDSLNQVYYWTLPNTSAVWSKFTPKWNEADSNVYTLPGDGTIVSVEIQSSSDGLSTTKIWWIGASPEILISACLSYKGAVVSKVDTAHTFKVGNFRCVNSPLTNLNYNPGVVPFTANMVKNTSGDYELSSWEGTKPFIGYQDPNMWEEWGYFDRAQQVLDFLLASQQAYTRQNTNRAIGPFASAYNWTSWKNGVNDNYNSWTFKDTIDPNVDWSGYQYKALVNVSKYWKSKPTDLKASSIVMTFLNYIDQFYTVTNNNRLPSLYPEFVDPSVTYISIQDSALIARAALYANLSGGDRAVTYRVFKKSLDFLNSEYMTTGVMSGTFTKSQANLSEGGLTIKELYGFQHAEIMITLAEIIENKVNLRYPPC